MKKIIAFLTLVCVTSAFAETYNLIGDRYLRLYTAETATPVYNASVDAALITEDLCKFPWVHSDVTQAVYTTHSDALLDGNIANRESFDAASFCARHTNSTHWAYANAAVYRYALPDGTLPKLTNLAVRVFSDPYNRYGARIVLMTNSTGEIPTDCATVRGNVSGSIVATNVAKRLAYSINSEVKWYPAYSNLVFTTEKLGAGGLQLQKYLFVFVLKENYAYVNGNWIEGSSYIRNKIEIMTDAAVPTWTDGATVNLAVTSAASSEDDDSDESGVSAADTADERDTADVTEATGSPWFGKMVCSEEEVTVIKCVDALSNAAYFAAPTLAYRSLHRGSTNLSYVTHAVFKYGSGWARGPATNLTGASGLSIRSIYPHKTVKILHRAARDAFGYKYLPTFVDMTSADVRRVADYANAFGLGDAYFATVTNLAATTRIPLGWILYTGATSAADSDGDTLDIMKEWDNGIYPTDPSSNDSDGDSIRDDIEYRYHLKGSDSGDDFDGDGLSNYSEYLISEVFSFMPLSPELYATTNGVCDYFRKVGELYLGEIFQDHDRIDDAWERTYSTKANYTVYDPARDDDNDGWSNYAEAKAGTNPGLVYSTTSDAKLPEFPVPTIEAKLTYAGKRTLTGQINFMAWNEKTDPEMTGAPDAIWQTSAGSNAVVRYVGKNPGAVVSYRLGAGSVREGSVGFAFRDVRRELVKLVDGVEVASILSTDSPEWYTCVYDIEGVLYFNIVTNAATEATMPCAVGTVDYGAGLASIDYAKVPQSTYRYQGEGEDAAVSESHGGYYTVTKVNLASSHVRVSWSPVNVDTSANSTYYLSDAVGGKGHVREGLTSFIVWSDIDGGTAGAFDPGEPMGVVKGVDVGWQGGSFAVTLSEMSGITPRFSPWNSQVSDRGTTVDESIKTLLSDRTKEYDASLAMSEANAETKIEKTIYDQVEGADAVNDKLHLRIVRFGMNNMFAYLLGVGFGNTSPNPIVIDRTYDKNGRGFICEADFLADGEFDLDWSRLSTEVTGSSSVTRGLGGAVTSVTYLAVLDGGSGHEYWLRGSYDTQTVIRASYTTIERRFELTKHAPVAQSVSGIEYAARPTFKWSLPNEEDYAKKYGTSYTAFKLNVYDESGNVVYDSGLRRAPAQDANGVFTWTAPCFAGDFFNGKFMKATGNYTWKVAMYNAKYKPDDSFANDTPSAAASFSLAVNAVQEMNDHQYSSIDVSVKYAGPWNVMKRYQDLSKNEGKVRVQAFATGDFAGEPLAEAVVTNGVNDFTVRAANVRLIGLPQDGTYYIRAYIDTDGDQTLDDWESWGAAKDSVVLTSDLLTAPVVGVWIENSDTDGDWLPDALEYAYYGELAYKKANVLSAGSVLFTVEKFNSATNRLASISTGFEGSSLTIFENGSWANIVLGWGSTNEAIKVENLREAVRSELDAQ